jgi:hypothetical protein
VEALQVQYKLTPSDFQAFDRYQWKSRRWIKWSLPVGVLIFPLLVAILTSGAWHSPQGLVELFKSMGIQLALPLVVVVLFYLFFLRRDYANLEKKSPELFGDRVTQITEEYFLNRDSQDEGRVFWPAIKQIDQDERCIFVLDKGDNGYIIPKRAFQKETDAALFFQTACRYWKPNTGNPW